MTKQELANRINISLKTLYNWETTKPELIRLIKLGLEKETGMSLETLQIKEEKRESNNEEVEELKGIIKTLRGVIETYQEIIQVQKQEKQVYKHE